MRLGLVYVFLLALLAAARQAFCERGYEQTTIEQIADRASVSSVTVFNYYRSKGSVLLAVVAESDRVLLEKIDTVIAAPPGDPMDAIVTFARTIFEHAFSTLEPHVWARAVATALTEGSSEFGRGYRELDMELIRRLSGLIAVLIAKGALRSDLDADTAADILYNLNNARFQEVAAGPPERRQEVERLARRDLTQVIALMRA